MQKWSRTLELDSYARNNLKMAIVKRGWIIHELDHFSGEDFLVRIVDKNYMTPFLFFICLKAIEHLKTHVSSGESFLTVAIQREPVKQWEQFGVPVILAIWNAETNSMYWTSVQSYIDGNENDSSREVFNVKIPLQNRLDNDGCQGILDLAKNHLSRLEKERLRLPALKKLENLIEADAKEGEFQQLLTEHPWMFGSEYIIRLERRKWTRDEQADFMLKRTADGFLEMIEIKTPMNGKPLFIEDDSRKNLYFRMEISLVICQVANYLEKIEAQRHSISFLDKEDVNKLRARIIIGRDGNEDQIQALRRLNSHLHKIEILTFDQLLKIAKRALE